MWLLHWRRGFSSRDIISRVRHRWLRHQRRSDRHLQYEAARVWGSSEPQAPGTRTRPIGFRESVSHRAPPGALPTPLHLSEFGDHVCHDLFYFSAGQLDASAVKKRKSVEADLHERWYVCTACCSCTQPACMSWRERAAGTRCVREPLGILGDQRTEIPEFHFQTHFGAPCRARPAWHGTGCCMLMKCRSAGVVDGGSSSGRGPARQDP